MVNGENGENIRIPPPKLLDREEYIQKMEQKLSDTTTYRAIQKDPTKKLQTDLASQLQQLQANNTIPLHLHRRLYPTETQIPRMYGLPKIHKEGYPLREIVDSCGSATKQIDKYVSRIIQSYIGGSDHFVKNSKHFTEKIADMKIEPDETLVSYDVTALYPSVPQSEAIALVHSKMINDPDLSTKTPIPAPQLTQLFKTCVETTYFMFNGKLYTQIDGLAIGASTSGFAAELFMQQLETQALQTFASPPSLWLRYVDDTFAKLKTTSINDFLTHLNQQHPRIKFTTEIESDSRIAFLDTWVNREPDGSTSITIHRKKTHTDQYLDFASNHPVRQKMGIISTMKHRIDTLVTKPKEKEKELDYVKKKLRQCGHPEWLLNRKKRSKRPELEETRRETRSKVVLPYTKTLSERISRQFKKHNIDVIHKPTTTIKHIVCNKLKDKVHPLDVAGCVYQASCKVCKDVHYVGEADRCLRLRAYDHGLITHKEANRAHSLTPAQTPDEPEPEPIPTGLRRSNRNKEKERVDYQALHSGSATRLNVGSSTVALHIHENDHQMEDVEIKILTRECNGYKRGVKEALAIQRLKPKLNEDEGRHFLSKLYGLIKRPPAKTPATIIMHPEHLPTIVKKFLTRSHFMP